MVNQDDIITSSVVLTDVFIRDCIDYVDLEWGTIKSIHNTRFYVRT